MHDLTPAEKDKLPLDPDDDKKKDECKCCMCRKKLEENPDKVFAGPRGSKTCAGLHGYVLHIDCDSFAANKNHP